jgi:hypothetical protein
MRCAGQVLRAGGGLGIGHRTLPVPWIPGAELVRWAVAALQRERILVFQRQIQRDLWPVERPGGETFRG